MSKNSDSIYQRKNLFLERAKAVHDDRYDYSKVEYVNTDTKVIIICKEHGEFLQEPRAHVVGQGCAKCYGNAKGNNEEFIKKSIEIHENKYNYSKVEYVNRTTEVKIICKEHGDFLQLPCNHWRG